MGLFGWGSAIRYAHIAILLVLCTSLACAGEAPDCASTIKELRALTQDPEFSQRWEETSMGDGKPIVVSINERNGSLLLEFFKTGEGLWAELSGVICKTGADLEARVLQEQVNLTPAAHWVFRRALIKGGVFTMRRTGSNQMRIETSAWSGRFASAATN